MSLLAAAVDAAGGMRRWEEISTIDLRFRCGGIAMPTKGQPDAIRRVTQRSTPGAPHVELHGLGTFDADDQRPCHMARRLRWKTADVVHFTGYAIWGYIGAPFIFAREDFAVRELSGRRLPVDFPQTIPTHCTRQTFHFDHDALLTRLDYTAEPVFGKLARAQHRCYEYRELSGLLVSTRRRVTPRGLPAPLLVSIDIDDLAAA